MQFSTAMFIANSHECMHRFLYHMFKTNENKKFKPLSKLKHVTNVDAKLFLSTMLFLKFLVRLIIIAC